MDLAQIIAALEAAEGPSPELDAEIALALGIERRVSGMTAREARLKYPDEAETFCRVFGVQPYTASLDAVKTLVLEGHDWTLSYANGAAMAGCSPADVEGCVWAETRAATPILALCIAALRARQAVTP